MAVENPLLFGIVAIRKISSIFAAENRGQSRNETKPLVSSVANTMSSTALTALE
ncbi:hypothetical protein [Algoriphagus sp. Y33]|uniref:hypothetical protein n=1 Tax=Algoriphagus sp. Y33 TaxID=2772483 RepID=UPI0017818979|nr:hypothetical protein [Algoriphagus sp. Y33]